MPETYLVGVLGEGPLFKEESLLEHKIFNHPSQQAPTVCPFCILYPEFECPICKEE